MYLSPCVSPPTTTIATVTSLLPARRGAARRDPLRHSFSIHAASILFSSLSPLRFFLLPSRSFLLSLRSFKSPCASSSPVPRDAMYVHAPTHRLIRTASSFALRIPRVLTHICVSPFSSPSPSSSSCAWHSPPCAHQSTTHTNDAASQPRRIVVEPVGSSRSRRLPISILFSRIRRNITARC